ncbi:hypothetical protein RF11_16038 [Thelohanellus kitauei]|uniref:Uncharacterized protein n=1 Tax=Thelohanellus kitauei TaxID=669202 RepID=A0A0C2IMD0_THEKT|nr:hypothetical protein RF11_16038 [Thelohanellus kitauei]
MEFTIKNDKGTFTQSDIEDIFFYPPNSFLIIQLENNDGSSTIKCKTVDIRTEFDFNNCTVNIQPETEKNQRYLRFKHNYKLNKKTQYVFSGESKFTHNDKTLMTDFTFIIYKLVIEFPGFTTRCTFNNLNSPAIYLRQNYIYPCRSKATKTQSDITTREVSDPRGFCCCIQGENVDKSKAVDKNECAFIFYANGCTSNSPNQCFPNVLVKMLKSAECKACKLQF